MRNSSKFFLGVIFVLNLIQFRKSDKFKDEKQRKEQLKIEIFEIVKNKNFPLTEEELVDISIKFFIDKEKSHIFEAVRKAENLEKTTDIEHEDYTSFLMLKHYLKRHIENLTSIESLDNFLNVENLIKHSKENADFLMKKIIENELDRQGIKDEEKRKEYLGELSEIGDL